MLATLATACGGSDKANTPTPTTPLSPTNPSTIAPAKFCDAAQAAKASADVQQKLFDAVDPPAAAAIQPAIEDFAGKFAAMNAISPAEIQADVATLNSAAQQLATIVRTNNYDVVAMVSTKEFAALNTTFGSDAYISAQDKFQVFLDTNCGFTTTPGT